jgi:protease-4
MTSEPDSTRTTAASAPSRRRIAARASRFAAVAAAAVAAATIAATAGCGARRGDERAEGGAGAKPDASPSPPAATPPAAAMGSPLGMLGSMMASRSLEPGPYEAPRRSSKYDEDRPHAAIIELDEPVVELRSFRLLGGAGGIELRVLADELRRLSAERHVTALLLRFGDTEIDMSAAEELRGAMVGFRRAGSGGRKIHCHADSAANVTYFVMSACDSIALSAGGDVIVTGAAAVPIHIKGALDRLGVEADFLHIGAFKGAAEPLTLDRPSREMVQTLEAILDERYAAMVEGIAEGRRLAPGRVRELIDTAVFPADQALATKLVDRVAGFDEFRDQVLDGAEWTVVKPGGDEPLGMGQLMQLLGAVPPVRPTEPHVALVYALGDVVDGDGGGTTAARHEIAPRVLGPALRALTADDSVKAVVLRVDSGGGSALASESLWQIMAELRKRKPVVVSMGGVAASGGYYIGCGATQIFASRTTLTGSIGVVGGKLAISRALAKIGVTSHPIGRGKRALMWSSLGLWSADEREAIRALMQGVYDGFLARVAEGRRKSLADVRAVAQGRVWTGAAAAQRGLVDRIGGLDDALAAARDLAGLKDTAPLEVYPPPPSLLDLLGDLGTSSLPFALDQAAARTLAALAPREATAVLTLYRQLSAFTTTPVQTALLWPVILR